MIWAVVSGFLIGSLPTADLVARGRGLDLRRTGTGNPGAANALRVGGRGLAAAVLILDLLKGAAAAGAGGLIGGSRAAAAAAVAAVAGQIHNPWFGFRGGKGLGVSAGATMALWPGGLVATLPILAGVTRLVGTAAGTVIAVVWYVAAAAWWASRDWIVPWGLPTDDGLVWFALGVAVLVIPKFASGIGHRPA